MVALISLLLDREMILFSVNINFYEIGMALLWVSMVFSVYSGILYGIKLKHVFAEFAEVE